MRDAPTHPAPVLPAPLARFLADEGGAATVEWVVMTAAVVGMGLAVMSVVSQGVENAARQIEAQLDGFTIMTSFEEWGAYRAQQAAAAAARAEAAAAAAAQEAQGDG